jgi:hypothetical protein
MFWNAIKRTVFWSYERGTWQYDLLVGGIILFVLFSPRPWFNDKAQVTSSVGAGQVVLQQQEDSSGLKSYRVDFHLLVSAPRTTELERRAHDVLKNRVEGLRGRTFQVVRIEPVKSEDGTVTSYDVWVK